MCSYFRGRISGISHFSFFFFTSHPSKYCNNFWLSQSCRVFKFRVLTAPSCLLQLHRRFHRHELPASLGRRADGGQPSSFRFTPSSRFSPFIEQYLAQTLAVSVSGCDVRPAQDRGVYLFRSLGSGRQQAVCSSCRYDFAQLMLMLMLMPLVLFTVPFLLRCLNLRMHPVKGFTVY